MKDLNSVQLIGRLGQDPNVQYTDTGTARTTFSVATNRTWTDADGQTQTETEWTRCTTWGKLAAISASLRTKAAASTLPAGSTPLAGKTRRRARRAPASRLLLTT